MSFAVLRLSKLGDPEDTFDVNFKLNKNKFVDKWKACVLEAKEKNYNISEPWAMYNISDSIDKEFLKKKLNNLMREIDKVEKVFDIQLHDVNDQDTLNKIHSIFEQHHGKLDTWITNKLFKHKDKEFRNNFSQINQTVHAIEGYGGSPKIRIVWFDLPKNKTFSEDDYDLFTNKRTFGSLYHLYCDVGKNIESLSEDNDDHHHDVVPNIHFSADCVAYFCTDSDEATNVREQTHKNYLTNNKKMLESKGYLTSDKKLTTGRIEIAKLQTDLSEQDFLKQIKRYNNIQSFFLHG